MSHLQQQKQEQIQLHKALLTEKQTELSSLVVELQKKRAPEHLIRQQQALQSEVKAKQRLLNSLSGIDVQVVTNFSKLMRGLAAADMKEISIEGFSIVTGNMNITGKAKYSNSVPLWLTQIQATDELSGLSFEELNITDESAYYSFQLSNSNKSEANVNSAPEKSALEQVNE